MSVAMARVLLGTPDVLVLDEPTNYLDLATKEMLVEALHAFEGTMLFVSHDRTFLRGLANRVLEIGGEDGTGRPVTYGGIYEEDVARSGHEAPFRAPPAGPLQGLDGQGDGPAGGLEPTGGSGPGRRDVT